MSLSGNDLNDARARINGPVLVPGDAGFAEEVTGFNLANQHRPDVVVGAATPSDVSEAVRFAAEHGLAVRVQSTGHGPWAPITDGMLICTRRMNHVSVDPDTKIATVGAGAKWLVVQAEAAPYGLTAITGSSPDVGAVGLTLGGGLGPLARSHGYTSDYAREFSVVTADGELVKANDSENPDLFWALRGGKGGLGVVTEMKIELVPLPNIYAGALMFDTEHIETVLRGWIDWTATAPDDVTTSVAMLRLPPFEEVPEPIRGRHVLALRFAYPGTEADGEKIAAPLRALAPVLMDMLGNLPTSQMGVIHSDPDQPLPAWDRGMLLKRIDQDFASALLAEVGPGVDVPIMVTEIRHLGGATTKDVAIGSAAGGRASEYTFVIVGVPDPSIFDRLPAIGEKVISAIGPWVSAETNVNFAGHIATPEHFASAWPEHTFQRLGEVRRSYDPDGIFAFGPVPAA